MKLFFFLLSLLFFAGSTHGGVETGVKLIRDTCNATAHRDTNVNYNFCTTSLRAAPASMTADLKGLGTISIGLIRKNATETRSTIAKLLKNQTPSPQVMAALKDCLELFSDVIGSTQDALKSYRLMKYNDTSTYLSAVMDAPKTCENGFAEPGKGFVSPLTERNNDAFQLGAISLSIVHILSLINST